MLGAVNLGRVTPPSHSSRQRSPLPFAHVTGYASCKQRPLRQVQVQIASPQAAQATGSDEKETETESKSAEYSEVMQQRMGTSLHYHHERGLDYNRIIPDLIVGSCLQTAADVDRLAEQEGVTTVYCLQEDSDMAYFNLDIDPIQQRCKERGDIKHVRFPIRDFDPVNLRLNLPKAVARLAKEHDPSNGTAYIHCTAGIGRAPATALAYMTWIRGYEIDDGFELMYSKRMCAPKLEAIRSATVDMLLDMRPVPTIIAIDRRGTAQHAQVAGLDVGWGTLLDMHICSKTKRFVLNRPLLPGRYQYKFVVDGRWTYSADHPSLLDGDNINNVVDVLPRTMKPAEEAMMVRLLGKGGKLTSEEHEALKHMLCPWGTHDSTPAAATSVLE